MRRILLWVLFIVALVLYSLVVYSWWLEGNSHQNIGIEQVDG